MWATFLKASSVLRVSNKSSIKLYMDWQHFKVRLKKKRDIDDPKRLRARYPQFQIGKGSYGNPTIHSWGEGTRLWIGAYCSIADGVQIFLGGEHRTDWITAYPFSTFWEAAKQIAGHPYSKGDVVIGNDVWIGTEAFILSGVKIGDGAVIGARTVVTKDVPPYAIVAGNPARVVKMRFDDETVARLLAIQWWTWDNTRIEKALPLLLNSDMEAFLLSAESHAI